MSQASSPPANTSSSSPSLLNNRCPSSITHSSSGFNPPRAEPSSTATTALPQSINARSQSRRRSRRAWFRRSNRRRASAHPSARSNMSSPPHDRSTYDATSVFSMPVPEPYSSSSTCTARSQGNDTPSESMRASESISQPDSSPYARLEIRWFISHASIATGFHAFCAP